MFPLYNVLNLDRSSLLFREQKAIFNMDRWLVLEIWDVIPVRIIFMVLLMITSIIFFIQEVIPIIKDLMKKEGAVDKNRILPVDGEIDSVVTKLSQSFGIEKPPVAIINDKNPLILTYGAKNHSILLSSGLISLLDSEQRQNAIAHEFAHIVRRSNATTWLIFLLRVLMFFNPIALIVFRRIVQDDEHVCDDMTVTVTKKPFVLASALKVFYTAHVENKSSLRGKVISMKDEIEKHSHNLLLKERIDRLESGNIMTDEKFGWGKFLLTINVIIMINYFVV
jgi:beta-lactamase regulating signal transducer with metallopeptidase domain